MRRRVVVTGLGAVTPIGNDVETFWNAVKNGKTGFGEITKFDTTDFKVKIAAEVKNFVAKERMDFKTAKRMDTFSQYAVASAMEAFEQAGLDMERENPFRVGVCVGSGIGGMKVTEHAYEVIGTRGPGKVNPLAVPMMISNMAAGNVAIALGAKGKCINVVTACATGSHSIGEAFRAIQYGEADVMITGGAESAITPVSVAGFTNLTALTTCMDLERASIPFDKERSGFVIGEGAGVVILEELEHAKARGAKILAEVAGYGATCDAYHITSPAEDGEGAAMAMTFAMEDAGIEPSQVNYINAHGTSTHHNDLFETRAIKKAFGETANSLYINSTKSMIGHLLGAAGGVEFIVCVKSILDSYIHPTVNAKEAEEECNLNYMFGEGKYVDIEYALSNSLGFGGHNASLLIKKYHE